MESKRKYKVVGIESDNTTVDETYTLEMLLTDDGYEITYSLQDQLDEILDLKLNGMMYLSLKRDCDESKGVIKRIN